MKRKKSLAQSTAEYATLLAIIIGAVTLMQVFLRRGQNAAIRDATITHYLNAGTGTNGLAGTVQFEPYYYTSNTSTSASTNAVSEIKGGGRYYAHSVTTANVTGYRNQLAVNGYENEANWGWNKTLSGLGL